MRGDTEPDRTDGASVARAVLPYVPFALVIGVLAALVPPQGNDFFQFWYAGRLVATGASPYEQARWAAAGAYGDPARIVVAHCPTPDAATCLWLYPPWTAWLYAPLGVFDVTVGLTAIAGLTLAALAVGLVLAARAFGTVGGWAGALTLGAVAASAPVERAAVGGHFLGLSLVGLVLLDAGLRRSRVLPFAAGAVLLALKPHVVIALPLLVAAELIRSRSARLLAAATALVAAALLAFALEPRALAALADGAARKVTQVPDNLALFAAPTVERAAAAGVLLIAGVAGAYAALVSAPRERRVAALVAVGAALSLVVAPYAHSYDFVLLVPAVLLAADAVRPRVGLLILAAFLVASWASYGLELARSPLAFPATLPVITLAALALAYRGQAVSDAGAARGAAPA